MPVLVVRLVPAVAEPGVGVVVPEAVRDLVLQLVRQIVWGSVQIPVSMNAEAPVKVDAQKSADTLVRSFVAIRVVVRARELVAGVVAMAVR